MKNQTSYIAYYRVSTTRQGNSGLGIEAQKTSVKHYVCGSGGELHSEFVEIESGKKARRPQLANAISQCKYTGAILLIAKLDRLARNVHFISGLIEAGVQFKAVDMPNADRFMLHVYAAMAEEEGRRIGARTKAALQAAKARGVKLGTNSQQLAAQNRKAADQHALSIGPQIKRLKTIEGLAVRSIAERLNSDNVNSYCGGQWHPTTVQRIWARYCNLVQI